MDNTEQILEVEPEYRNEFQCTSNYLCICGDSVKTGENHTCRIDYVPAKRVSLKHRHSFIREYYHPWRMKPIKQRMVSWGC
jgi:hypothetical protein